MFAFPLVDTLAVAGPALAVGERVAVGSLGRASAPDLLRLLAVPVFGWAAYRDLRTRRVPNETWYPLLAVGLLALAWEGWLALDAAQFRQRLLAIRVAVSLGLVAPLGYLFWRLGGFGGADAKAVMVLALLFPSTPSYLLVEPPVALPVAPAPLGVLSLSILSNTVVLALLYPVWLLFSNAAWGRFALPMVVGRPVPTERLVETYGRLLETPRGYTRAGLDVDALRMYLRWRGTTLAALRADPDRYRDPRSLPAVGNDPGDGALGDGRPVADGGTVDGAAADASPDDGGPTRPGPNGPGDLGPATAGAGAADSGEGVPDDPWGAARFLAAVGGSAYGTTPATLRDGLEVAVSRDRVWLTPGVPFVVPMFVGLVVALTYGDLLYALLVALGLA